MAQRLDACMGAPASLAGEVFIPPGAGEGEELQLGGLEETSEC
jgi:hypothetical protein